MNAQEIIAALGLAPLPGEGGYYRETWRSSECVPGERSSDSDSASRSCGTAIYYLLTEEAGCFSAIHRLKSDEVYHFYLGDPVELFLFVPEGIVQQWILGSDLAAGQRVQAVVPSGVWQGLRLRAGGQFALLGTTMAPGFDFRDCTLAERGKLSTQYPLHADLIAALTR